MPGKPYWSMTNQELEAICNELGIDFDPKDRKSSIHKIRAVRGELVESGDSEESAGLSRKDFVIVRFHHKDEQDLPYVYVGLNGRSWYLPKERDIIIPKEILSVIDDAVEVKFVQRRSPDGSTYMEEKKVHRFPYTIVEK